MIIETMSIIIIMMARDWLEWRYDEEKEEEGESEDNLDLVDNLDNDRDDNDCYLDDYYNKCDGNDVE